MTVVDDDSWLAFAQVEDEEARRSALWAAYRRAKTIENRNALVEEYTWIIRQVAGSWLRGRRSSGHPDGTPDALFTYGAFGLISAVQLYDEKLGSFIPYARQRIQYAIKDGWRETDWLSRKGRSLIKEFVHAEHRLIQQMNAQPSVGQIYREMGAATSKARHAVSAAVEFAVGQTSYIEPVEWSVAMAQWVYDEPEQAVINKYMRTWLQDVCAATLDGRTQVVFQLYYWDRYTLKEIGHMLGITESRVCQLHVKGLKKLRSTLKVHWNMNSNLEEEFDGIVLPS